jgi:hypothetical protein
VEQVELELHLPLVAHLLLTQVAEAVVVILAQQELEELEVEVQVAQVLLMQDKLLEQLIQVAVVAVQLMLQQVTTMVQQAVAEQLSSHTLAHKYLTVV